MANALIFLGLLLFVLGYWYRGRDLPQNKVVWTLASFLGAFCILLDWKLAALVALGATAGQWISHGESFRVESNRMYGPWFSISVTRGLLLTAPIGLHFVPLVVLGFYNLVANWFSLRLEKYTGDMFPMAELLQGLGLASLLIYIRYFT